MDDLEVYLINLDRSQDRLQLMDKKLRNMNLKYKRISAVDGQSALFSPNEIDEEKYSLAHGKYTTPTEIACFMSHYNAIVDFYNNSRKKYALILEDDMDFDDDFCDVVRDILRLDCWDVVKLNGAHGGGRARHCRINEKYSLVFNWFHQSKSGAYLINKVAAFAYIQKMLPMFVPFDHEFIKYWKYGLRGYSVYPFPCREGGISKTSTIDYKMVKKNRKPFFKKFPTLCYKMFIALRRIVWGCFNM